MKRSTFKPKWTKPERRQIVVPETPPPMRAGLRMDDWRARLTVPLPKSSPVRNEAYRRLVSALPCAHCGKPGPSQAAHADEGKGVALKACDLQTYPLCADSPGRHGCHWIIGSTGLFTQQQRRELERRYVAQTREKLEGQC